jgi:hypothetical protein
VVEIIVHVQAVVARDLDVAPAVGVVFRHHLLTGEREEAGVSVADQAGVGQGIEGEEL